MVPVPVRLAGSEAWKVAIGAPAALLMVSKSPSTCQVAAEPSVARNCASCCINSIGSQAIPLAASVLDARPALRSYEGKEVAVGVRPEYCKVTNRTNPLAIQGTVEVRESLGIALLPPALDGASSGKPVKGEKADKTERAEKADKTEKADKLDKEDK